MNEPLTAREAPASYQVMLDEQRVRPGYKLTEVGVIPVDWEIKSCKDTCVKIQDGTHFSPTIRGNDYFYVTSKNVRFGFLDFSNADRIDAVQHDAIYKRCDVRRGDILLTKDGANTGNAALNDLEEEFSLLSSVAFLRFDPQKHDANYFLQQILSTPGQQQIKEAMSGNAITRLTLAKINKLRFPVAPVKEQRAIAAALSDVDALLAKLDQLIAKKRDLKQAAMQQLLTGSTRLPGFSGEWELVKAGDIGRFRGGSGFPTVLQGAKSGEYPLFKVSDMNNVGNETFMETANNYISEALRKQLGATVFPAESIVFAKVGAAVFLERKKILSRASCLDNNMAAFVMDVNRAYCPFIHYVLLNTKLGNLVSTTALPSLSGGVLAAIELSLPSLPEQTAIATILSDMDTELAALEARRAKTRDLKQGMMQELLTGRIRLV